MDHACQPEHEEGDKKCQRRRQYPEQATRRDLTILLALLISAHLPQDLLPM